MITAALAPELVYSAPWWVILLALLAAAGAIGTAIWLAVFLIRRIENVTWRRQTVVRRLRFQNSGNVPGVIQFVAAAASDDLSFRYLLDGQPLSLHSAPLPEPAAAQHAASPPVSSREVPPAAAGAAQTAPAAPGMKDAAAARAKAVKVESKKILGKSRIVVSILGTLGSLIPGEWGKSLKDRSTALQNEVQKAGQAIETPEVKLQAARSLQGQVQSLGPAKPAPQSGQLAAAVAPAPILAVGAPAPGAESVPPVAAAERPRPRPAIPLASYVQTPAIPPEGALVVELRIEPRERYRTADYSYWLVSCQMEQESTPAAQPLVVQRTRQSVRVKGLPWGYLVLTFVLDTTVLCLNALWVVLFIDWLARLIA